VLYQDSLFISHGFYYGNKKSGASLTSISQPTSFILLSVLLVNEEKDSLVLKMLWRKRVSVEHENDGDGLHRLLLLAHATEVIDIDQPNASSTLISDVQLNNSFQSVDAEQAAD
jgi:hypothetical protein